MRQVPHETSTGLNGNGSVTMEMRILNVGCGRDSYGTDFVDKYPSRSDILEVDVDRDRLPFDDGTFDEVYSRCVLEHLQNPNIALKEMIRVLKRGGKLRLITDNAGFWAFHTPFSKIHYGGYEMVASHGEQDMHYSLFTSWHLENHLRAVGLSDVRIEYIDMEEILPSLSVRVVSRLLRFVGLTRIAYPRIMAEAKK